MRRCFSLFRAILLAMMLPATVAAQTVEVAVERRLAEALDLSPGDTVRLAAEPGARPGVLRDMSFQP